MRTTRRRPPWHLQVGAWVWEGWGGGGVGAGREAVAGAGRELVGAGGGGQEHVGVAIGLRGYLRASTQRLYMALKPPQARG